MGRVLVLGNAGLDISLTVPRLPERGETLLGDNVSHAPGGKGLNQAVTAARTGVSTRFHAPIGRDAQAEEIRSAISAEASLQFDPAPLDQPSDFSLLMVMPDGENSIVSAGSCAMSFPASAAADFATAAEVGDVLVVQGNLTQEATLAALQAASDRGATTLLNPAPLWWEVKPLLPFSTIVVANRGEAEAITGTADPAKAAALLRQQGVSIAVITLGAEGCLVQQGAAVAHHSATPVDVKDTTGCGDTFCGVLAAALAMGRMIDDAIDFAQAAAAITATRAGAFAALPSARELLDIFAGKQRPLR
jgi:ribokinase